MWRLAVAPDKLEADVVLGPEGAFELEINLVDSAETSMSDHCGFSFRQLWLEQRVHSFFEHANGTGDDHVIGFDHAIAGVDHNFATFSTIRIETRAVIDVDHRAVQSNAVRRQFVDDRVEKRLVAERHFEVDQRTRIDDPVGVRPRRYVVEIVACVVDGLEYDFPVEQRPHQFGLGIDLIAIAKVSQFGIDELLEALPEDHFYA